MTILEEKIRFRGAVFQSQAQEAVKAAQHCRDLPLFTARGSSDHAAVVSRLADLILVSGPMAGAEPDVQTVDDVREAFDPSVPVLLNTGANAVTIARYLKFADGYIVGSDLERDGYNWIEVDREHVKRFVDAARSA